MTKEKSGTRCINLISGQARPGANLAFLKAMPIFCKKFNEETKEKTGEQVRVKIVTYKDGSYEYKIEASPSSHLIKKTIGEKKEITQTELEEIAKKVITSLNTDDLEQAKKILTGTIRSFGDIKIIET